MSHDAAASERTDRLLLHDAEPDDTEEAAVRSQLAALHLTLLSEVVAQDGAVVDADWQLFTDALAEHHDAQDAGVLVLTVLLQDVRMVFY